MGLGCALCGVKFLSRYGQMRANSASKKGLEPKNSTVSVTAICT